ncbi:hypothetical protein PZ739_11435 [Pseudomonas kermanshahensis]|uniref:hypothetical protein n=1 Tax=Pseudomonas kermanshahensis TaxID=2745482 RepID=UPI0023DA2E89|nr:hypothetical protein [Pseudomonas kermanshahensis]WEL57728.1 hypothetical protein PZ739_11435 [Pseudomonas kermanshahensis]
MRRWALLLCCLAGWAVADDPQVRVETRLVPGTTVMTGATLSLEVDLLVDTWFTDAPVLPALQLPGAVVSPPSGEAQHLNEKREGKAFFGLRYRYAITPTQAQRFDIPALTFRVQPGPSGGPQAVISQPLSFEAKALAGSSGGQHLVARSVRLSQEVQYSHQPLRVGDSVTRHVHVDAEGTQAMLLPAPVLAEVDGLKRYLQTPSIKPLSDGRGGTLGGQRDDSASYIATAAGRYRLPAIDLQWWDAATGEQHSVSVPAVELVAEEGVYQAPFSLAEDLRALGQNARVSIASHGLLLTLALLLLGGLAWAGRAYGQAGWQWLRAWRLRRRQAWLASEGYAWRQARRQCAHEPARLDGLYLWFRRASGQRTLSSSEHPPGGADLLAFFEAVYGPHRGQGLTTHARRSLLSALRQQLGTHPQSRPDKNGLRDLNP